MTSPMSSSAHTSKKTFVSTDTPPRAASPPIQIVKALPCAQTPEPISSAAASIPPERGANCIGRVRRASRRATHTIEVSRSAYQMSGRGSEGGEG